MRPLAWLALMACACGSRPAPIAAPAPPADPFDGCSRQEGEEGFLVYTCGELVTHYAEEEMPREGSVRMAASKAVGDIKIQAGEGAKIVATPSDTVLSGGREYSAVWVTFGDETVGENYLYLGFSLIEGRRARVMTCVGATDEASRARCAAVVDALAAEGPPAPK